MKVVLTGEARQDLQAIGDHVALDNPAAARRLVRNLIACARELGEHPRRFQRVPHSGREEVRRRVFGNYLVFYRVETGRVSVIHILHGARDYAELLFPDDPDDPAP